MSCACRVLIFVQVGVLRWSLSTTDESQMPLTINCWPEPEGGGQMNVSMEYELVCYNTTAEWFGSGCLPCAVGAR